MRLILLHALPLDGRQWQDQMDVLPSDTLAPNLYSLGDNICDWANGVLDMAGRGPLIVVGNSVGGSCALEMARRAPERIDWLVLVGTKAGHRPEPEFRDRFIESLKCDREGTVRRWLDSFFGPNVDPETRNRARRIADEQNVADLIRGVRVFHSRPDASDVLLNWPKRLVIIRGEHDGTTVEQPSENRQIHVVPDCGHYVNLEQPTVFNSILRELI